MKAKGKEEILPTHPSSQNESKRKRRNPSDPSIQSK
jgi:hypothetical protein